MKPGNRFFFTANLNVSGNTNIPVTDAKQDGFTAYAVKPDNKDIQMCFAGALYQYTLKISIDWGESLIEGKFTIKKKKPANAEAVSLPADTDYYNMAGIRYTVYADKKCTEKIGANIVLSYDGIAYQDKDGANIVFDCAAAKQHYTDTYGKNRKFTIGQGRNWKMERYIPIIFGNVRRFTVGMELQSGMQKKELPMGILKNRLALMPAR